MAEQLSWLEDPPRTNQIVNVASVPQRSPFRYPGGKTWLIPRIRQWLGSLSARPREFIEPFAGGGIVGLTVGFERLADHVSLVELDEQVAAVWEAVINQGEGPWLAERIIGFSCTREAIEALLAQEPASTREKAFQTIVQNRTSRGGILANGAGRIKHGENGKGIASRWYAGTLKRRILDIDMMRDRFTFIQGDGLQVMEQHAQQDDAVYFIDPPYTAGGKRAGRRLYTHSELDHERLFQIAESVAGDFLMTYDNAQEIHKLAAHHGFDVQSIAMKNTHHAEMTELVVGRDLGWVRSL